MALRPVQTVAALLGLLWLGAAGASLSRADTSACRASAELRPSVAVVGQQILYRVRIVRRQDVEKVDWARGLSFPDFRAEWLPGHAEDTEMHYRGMTFVARSEDRALFPTRAGVFEIPEASLTCTIRGRGPEPSRSETIRVAPVRVRIVEPPVEGRPDGFTGAVGPLWVQTSTGAQQIHLGESVSVSILVRGAANLWDLPVPLGVDALEGEIFWKPTRIELETGEQLYLRRYYRFDVVPRETGSLVIPPVRVPYYDFRTGHYEVAEAAAVEVEVLPRAGAQASSAPSARAESLGRSGLPAASQDATGLGSWVAAAALLLGCVGAVPVSRAVRRHRRWLPTREALHEADRAGEAKDWRQEAASLSRALYSALAVAVPEIESPSPKTLREPGDFELDGIADAIDALERARFSPDPSAADRDGARAAVARLRAR